MKYIYITILASFVSIIFFGIFSMQEDMNHVFGGCIAYLLNRINCPPDAIAAVGHHMSLYNAFLQVLNIFPLIFSIIFLLFYLLKKTDYFPTLGSIQNKKFFSKKPLRIRLEKFFNWLSLLENSPSFEIGA